MNTEQMLRFIRRHTFEAIFKVMRVAVNYRKGQNHLKEIVLHLKKTLARPPIYDRVYHEQLSTGFTGKPVRVTKLNLSSLFVQQGKFLWKCQQVFLKSIFCFVRRKKEKFALRRTLHQIPLLYTFPNVFSISSDMHHKKAR